MTVSHTPTGETETRFLTVLAQHLDNWFADDANLDDLDRARDLIRARLAALNRDHLADSGTGPAAITVLVTELHRLRRSRARTTITTHSGHIHYATVRAVHARYVVLGVGPGEVLLPLEFIETLTRPGQETHA